MVHVAHYHASRRVQEWCIVVEIEARLASQVMEPAVLFNASNRFCTSIV